MSDRPHSIRGLRSFAGDNPEIELRQFRRVMRGSEIGVEFVSSGNAQAVLVETFRMLGPTNKGPYLSNLRQVRGVQTSDRTATDDADSFDQIVSARSCLRAGARIFDPDHRSESTRTRSLQRAKNRIASIV